MLTSKQKRLFNVSDYDFRKWCITYKKSHHDMKAKREFFALLNNNLLVRDKSGNFIYKHELQK